MFTLIGHSESHAAGSALTKLAAITDTHIRTEGDNAYIPEYNQIVGVYANGLGTTRAQLDSPSLRDFIKIDVNPVETATTSSGVPAIMLKPENPVALATNEALNAYCDTYGSADLSRQSVFTMLSDGAISPVTGEIHTIEFTAPAPSTTNAWETETITFGQTLPVGRYQVVGCRVNCPAVAAYRLIPVGSFWRPGGPGFAATSTEDIPELRNGKFGVWCEFDQLTPPSIEVFCTAAGEQIVGYLDLIKI